jgi:hypothetical protein
MAEAAGITGNLFFTLANHPNEIDSMLTIDKDDQRAIRSNATLGQQSEPNQPL